MWLDARTKRLPQNFVIGIIDHNMSIKGVKVDIVGFYLGSEWGWTYIPLVPQYWYFDHY
jgi:hypothetical protein